MSVAIYQRTLNKVYTFVTQARGELPPGCEFCDESDLPPGWELAAPSESLPVPQEISLRQFLMAADRSGLLASLEALKTNEAIPDRIRRDVHFFLEYSNFIERNHPMIAQLAPIVGVTEGQIDDVFRAGSKL